MKKFLTVLEFELMNYVKNKGFMLSTIIFALIIAVGMFVPNIMELVKGNDNNDTNQAKENEEKDVIVVYDKANIFIEDEVLIQMLPQYDWQFVTSEDEVKKQVEEETAESGFIIQSSTSYDYVVNNKSVMDSISEAFSETMAYMNRVAYCEANGIDFEELEMMYQTPIVANDIVLGKDNTQNYWYCYALVIVIFIMVSTYGVMIATSVTSEKSNRSIEVLVTSTNPNGLLFGKVIAGAIASLFQVGVILGVTILCYRFNRENWGEMALVLDMFLNIPNNVLFTYAIFGIGGYLFYAFLYGAIGALVSKTEDISKSASGVQMVVMIVYFVVLFQLSNVDGIFIKVASFLPISSYSAMFARVAMGKVAMWEIVVSAVILYVSVFLMGILGAKLYRMGTLRYGNPINFVSALKGLKDNK